MPLEVAGQNACLTGGLGNAVAYISAHSGIPNSSGSNELTGGTPTYARQAVTWAAASGGTRANSGSMSHDIPAGSTVYCYGLWSAVTSGTYYGYVPLNGSVRGFGTVDSTGVTNDTVTSSGHGLANTNRVILFNVLGETIPAGLTEGTVYYVVSAATDTFKVALTSGGSAVDLTGQGEVYFQSLIPETYGSQGTLTTASSALVLDASAV